MSQFSQAYTAATIEAIGTIDDLITYNGQNYQASVSEETYGNSLGDGGFEVSRTLRATVVKSTAPGFRLGGRVNYNERVYRITGIETDEASIDLSLSSPDSK